MLSSVLGVDSWPDLAAVAVFIAAIFGATTGFMRWVLTSIKNVIQDELRPLVERVTKLEQWREIVDFEIDHLKITTQKHDEKLREFE